MYIIHPLSVKLIPKLKSSICFLIFLFFTSLNVNSQDYDWVKTFGSNQKDYCVAIAQDLEGNVVSFSNFADTILVGHDTIKTTGGLDIAIITYNKLGGVKKIIHTGLGKYASGLNMACIDNKGNIYLAGAYYGDIIFDTDTIKSTDATSNSYLVKLDSSGNLIWYKKGRGVADAWNFSNKITDVTVNSNHEIFITGIHAGKIVFDSDSVVGYDGFICKLDSTGSVKWLQGFDGYNHVRRVRGDLTGGCYLYYNSPDIGEKLVHYSTNGSELFNMTVPIPNYGLIESDMEVDKAGSIVLSYRLNNVKSGTKFELGTNVITTITKLVNGVLIKLDSTGTMLWNKLIGRMIQGANNFSNITTDSACDIYLSTRYGAMKYSSTGKRIWEVKNTDTLNVTSVVTATDILADNNGSLYMTGVYVNMQLLNQNFTSKNGQDDIYVTKISANKITGTVFNDLNGNLVQDTGDLGLPNRVVVAYPYNYFAETDSDGNYELYVGANTYTVSLAPFSGWTQIYPSTPFTHSVTIVGKGQVVSGYSFTAIKNNVSGVVYVDNNRNCMYDSLEFKASGVKILISPGNKMLVSDSVGFYSVGLMPGSYTFSIIKDSITPYMLACPAVGLSVVVDSVVQYVANKNIGLIDNTISGKLFWDKDNNCLLNGSDNGLGNIQLKIMPGPFYVNTDVSGKFRFGLDSGFYQIETVKKSFYTSTGVLVKPTCSNNVLSIKVDSLSQTIVNKNLAAGLPTIRARAYFDSNFNCNKDSNDINNLTSKFKLLPTGTYITKVDVATGDVYYYVTAGLTYTVTLSTDSENFAVACPFTKGFVFTIDTISKTYFADFAITNNTLSGFVFWDQFNDCYYDTLAEQPIKNQLLKIEPGPRFAITNDKGYFQVGLDSGNFNISAVFPAGVYKKALCPLSGVNNVSIINPSSQVNNINFGLNYIAEVNDLRITLTPINVPRPGFNNLVNINISNVGTDTVSGFKCVFKLDSVCTYMGSTILPDIQYADSVEWSSVMILPNQEWSTNVILYLPPDVKLLGKKSTLISMVYPIFNDTTPVNNIDTLIQTIVGSYDPNLKNVEPEGNLRPNDTTALEYTIHFQNTGLASAINVVVVDTIDTSFLDITSFVALSSSHKCKYDIRGGDIVVWTFDNINLPDSNSNEEGSHGFVKFKINTHGNLAVGKVVENKAGIYFDFNEPIITNKASNLVYKDFSISVNYNKANEPILLVYPNPSSGPSINLVSPQASNFPFTCWLYDHAGKCLDIVNGISLNNFQVNISQYPAGVYYFKLFNSSNLCIGGGKFICK